MLKIPIAEGNPGPIELKPCGGLARYHKNARIVVVVNYLSSDNTTPMNSHPLDLLNENEITKAVEIINDQAIWMIPHGLKKLHYKNRRKMSLTTSNQGE